MCSIIQTTGESVKKALCENHSLYTRVSPEGSIDFL